MQNKTAVVANILARTYARNTTRIISSHRSGYAWAPANLALCKYWGKRNTELNLPLTASISISLGKKGTFTLIEQNDSATNDIYILNGKIIAPKTIFAKRLRAFLDLFRPTASTYYHIKTISTVPVAAGLASSASGYAALVLALNNLYDWNLTPQELSVLARLGSGSACRSLWHGFVEWDKGNDNSDDGMDSYAHPLPYVWKELRIGILMIDSSTKAISSRDAMLHTFQTSPLSSLWQEQSARDLAAIKEALESNNFELFGVTSEQNSLLMHALMQSARPPIMYSQPATLAAMQRVWDLRRAGIPAFFTQDAGPNLKLLFLEQHTPTIEKAFPEITIIAPFTAHENEDEKLIVVDENDNELSSGEKMEVHLRGTLHRAFSVVIFRRRHSDNKIELLLQQRATHKYHSVNLWTNTCCGHPRPNEETIVAATRRLKEEMGMEIGENYYVTALHEISAFSYRAELADSGLIENEIDHVFVGEVKFADRELFANKFIKINPQEVQNYCWIELEALRNNLALNPEKYTVWLNKVVEKISFSEYFTKEK